MRDSECQGKQKPSESPGNIAIIGGTGFCDLPDDIFAEPVEVVTDAGVVTALSISHNYTEPARLYFLPRHGPGHRWAPHEIAFRANIAALAQLGVRYVYATNAVGALRRETEIGAYMVLSDFIDFTRSRPLSYFGEGADWRHTDFSEPYSGLLRSTILRAASELERPVIDGGVYVCCDGPRYESPAEIRMFRAWGGDVVGMTGLPEAVMAREAGMEYAAVAVATNYAAGVTQDRIGHGDVTARMEAVLPELRELLLSAAGRLAARLYLDGGSSAP